LATLGAAAARRPLRDAWLPRSAEEALLARALVEARTRARLVVVEGPSGAGKSALVHRFAHSLRDRALVLAGRCFEQETVPHKTLDGIMDALAAHLTSLPRAQADKLVPSEARALARLFPVLERAGAIGVAPPVDGEPHDLRRAAFAALRE